MQASRIGFVVGLSAEARLLRHTGFAVGIGGATPAGAARAAEKLVADGAAALVSFGLAGGLDPALVPGAVLVAQRVIDGGVFYCDNELTSWLGGADAKTMLSANAAAQTAGEKAALFAQTGADAIDLESGAVARVAQAAKIPFAVLRAIADPAQRNLPPAALIALNGAGEIGFLPVLASVFKNPSQIPALIKLAREAALARAALMGKVRALPVARGAGLTRPAAVGF